MKKTKPRSELNIILVTAGCLLPALANAQLILSNAVYEADSLLNTNVEMSGRSELHVSDSGNPVTGSVINMSSIDSWVFLHNVKPGSANTMLSRFRINSAAAVLNSNIKMVQYGQGTVVIPYSSDFQPLEVFDGENFSGDSLALSAYASYGAVLGGKTSSFTLKRGYSATLSRNSNGTGESINYVAADGDLRIGALPDALNNHVYFIRVYPWHWVAKKGSCDISPAELNAQWFYNWSLTFQPAVGNYEYVAIKQQPYWPALPSPGDCNYLGINHVSGLNEPNNPVEDAYKNLTPQGSISDAVARHPELLGTGLRVGAPAVTDGGYQWISDFINGTEAAGHRLDYVPIHYYRSYWNNDDPATAANNLYNFLKSIYDLAQKPIWLTEFNNGANWTTDAAPSFAQNRNMIEAMINMMDDTPWIERYSVYSAVEEVRQVYYNAGGYTPMGQMYKDHESPIGYQQIIPGEGMEPSAMYHFEKTLTDASGSGNHAVSKNYPDFVAGQGGGSALAFNGVDDHVVLPDSLSDGTDFTFAAWVYWNGGAAWQRIFDFGVMESGRYMFLTPNASGAGLRFAVTSTSWSGEQKLNAPSLAQNTWTHVALTLSGNTGRLYINGAQVDSQSITLNPANLGAIQHYLGRSQFAADPYFSGKMDDVILTDQALSLAQIAALMNNQPPEVSTPLIDGGTATEGVLYTNTVVGIGSDPDGGAVTYSKVYGASWLSVASNGALSGTPSGDRTGDQTFTVRATDAAGASVYCILKINVVAIQDDFTRGPIAYWDFNDPSMGAANGAAIPDSDAYTVWREAATDKSGNGNHLTSWQWDWAGFNWSSNSAEGDFSIVAAGAFPAAFTWSSESGPSGLDIESAVLSNFTVEARFTVTGSGNRTVLGRDGQGVSTTAADNAALYFGVDGNNHPLIEFTDANGETARLIASSTTLLNDHLTWYHLAGVYNGSTLSLYLNDVLIASKDVTLGAMAVDASSGSGWHGGGWSIARGLWAGGHEDRWNGHIDSVAISGVALKPGRFVITGTWPEGYQFYFDSHGISGASFEGDEDTNGVPNGMEYYLGSNPLNPLSPSNTLWWSSDYLAVSHPYNPAAYGVTGLVEWTADLVDGPWTNAGVTYMTNAAAGEMETQLGSSTTTQLFIRLKVNY